MNNARKWTLLTTYVVAIVVVFLYLLFPSETVKTYIGYRMSGISPEVGFDIDQVRLGIPPGLSLQDLDLHYQGKSAVRFDRMELVPAYLSLFTSDPTVKFTGLLAGGGIKGWTGISESGPMHAQLILDAVQLDQLPVLRTFLPIAIGGAASGELHYDAKGVSQATLKIADCRIAIDPPMMGIKELTFTRMEADAEMNGQEIGIKRVEFNGPQGSGTGSGTLLLRQPMETSRINLTGTIKPHPSMIQSVGALLPKQYLKDGGIPVQITGTLKQPNFSIR